MLTEEWFEERIERITESGCWIWLPGLTKTGGYGQFNKKGKVGRAHRASYEFYVGKIPEGMCVCHRCDTPACINPDHLFIGSRKENTLDMKAKGRHLYGERNTESKLTLDQVLEIKDRRKSGEYFQSIADSYGISYTQVWRIINNKRWVHTNSGDRDD